MVSFSKWYSLYRSERDKTKTEYLSKFFENRIEHYLYIFYGGATHQSTLAITVCDDYDLVVGTDCDDTIENIMILLLSPNLTYGQQSGRKTGEMPAELAKEFGVDFMMPGTNRI